MFQLCSGRSSSSAISAVVAGRPKRYANSIDVAFQRATISVMYEGTRTVLTVLISARRMPCLIHHVAYVEKRQPALGSNFSTAFIRPMLPSSMRSKNATPRLT